MTKDGLVQAARGAAPSDLLFTNARVVNVFTGEVMETEVAVSGGYVAGFGPREAREVVDAGGRYLVPGLVDAHVHVESSMLTPRGFARAVARRGTTCVVADPHEIANVWGAQGVRFMLEESRNLPVRLYYTVPSCVPATHLETAGANLDAQSVGRFFSDPLVVGLAEAMNYPGVIFGDPAITAKIQAALASRRRVDGHAPGLSGPDLHAYVAAGAASDHECTTAKEALEKLGLGMYLMIREGTGAKNLHNLLPAVTAATESRCMWCTDDRHAEDILGQGHVDSMVAEAVRAGMDPLRAIRLGTLHPANYFGLHEHGAIAPGRRADVLLVSDLREFRVEEVFCAGVRAEAEDAWPAPAPRELPASMNVHEKSLDFAIPARGRRVRVIGVVPGQIVTRAEVADAVVENGFALAAPERDLLKLAVAERHHGSGNQGLGFVRGFGMKNGALAATVAHDSHNLIVLGASDEDMRAAADAVCRMGGGMAVAAGGKALAEFPLPVAGLMSGEPIEAVAAGLEPLARAARDLECVPDDPFMTLSFLALPVIPELKLTDKGLVDVAAFAHVDLFTD